MPTTVRQLTLRPPSLIWRGRLATGTLGTVRVQLHAGPGPGVFIALVRPLGNRPAPSKTAATALATALRDRLVAHLGPRPVLHLYLPYPPGPAGSARWLKCAWALPPRRRRLGPPGFWTFVKPATAARAIGRTVGEL